MSVTWLNHIIQILIFSFFSAILILAFILRLSPSLDIRQEQQQCPADCWEVKSSLISLLRQRTFFRITQAIFHISFIKLQPMFIPTKSVKAYIKYHNWFRKIVLNLIPKRSKSLCVELWHYLKTIGYTYTYLNSIYLKDIMLSEITQREKYKYCMLSFTHDIKNFNL